LINLPEQCAKIAILGLCGTLPIEGEIHIRALNLFRDIAANESFIEHTIAVRQLTIKDRTSNSWFVYVNEVLAMYSLPSAHNILAEPPPKQAWKRTVKTTILQFWQEKYHKEAAHLSSIRYMSGDTLCFSKPALVWSSTIESPRECAKARSKAKLLCGCLKLQGMESRWKVKGQKNKSPICLLCSSGPETRKHFVLDCESLHSVRKPHLERILSTLGQSSNMDDDTLLQAIIDVTHESLHQKLCLNEDERGLVEMLSRDLVHSLYRKRLQLLNTCRNPGGGNPVGAKGPLVCSAETTTTSLVTK
jgi:hypothetical protein